MWDFTLKSLPYLRDLRPMTLQASTVDGGLPPGRPAVGNGLWYE